MCRPGQTAPVPQLRRCGDSSIVENLSWPKEDVTAEQWHRMSHAQAKKCGWFLKLGKSKETDSPLETPEKNTVLQNLDFSPARQYWLHNAQICIVRHKFVLS